MDGIDTLLSTPMLGTNPAGASNLFGTSGGQAIDQSNLFGPTDLQTTSTAAPATGVYTPTRPDYLSTYDTGEGDLQRLLKSIYTPNDTSAAGQQTKADKPPGQDALVHQPDQTQDSGYAQTQKFLQHGKDFVESFGEGHDQAIGNATTFGLDYGAKINSDGSVDSRYWDAVDNGKGAFGYNTRDPNLVGASLPIPVIQNSIGDYIKDPKVFEAIRRGDYKVLVTDSNGHSEIMPIVDAGPAEWTGNALDLTYKASHLFNTEGKAKLGYQIIGPDGNTVSIKGYHPHNVSSTNFDSHVAPKTATEQTPSEESKAGSYTTKLSDDDEKQFQQWVKQNNIPWQDVPNADYDMRGYWKAQQAGDPNAVRSSKNLHFPDTYKTPFHKTFSNESQYATPDAPHWVGDRLIDKNGKVVADETEKKPEKIISAVTTAAPKPKGETIDWKKLGYKSFEDYQKFVNSLGIHKALRGEGTTATLAPLE